jgi:outer membrane lipoprotein SlyB
MTRERKLESVERQRVESRVCAIPGRGTHCTLVGAVEGACVGPVVGGTVGVCEGT